MSQNLGKYIGKKCQNFIKIFPKVSKFWKFFSKSEKFSRKIDQFMNKFPKMPKYVANMQNMRRFVSACEICADNI